MLTFLSRLLMLHSAVTGTVYFVEQAAFQWWRRLANGAGLGPFRMNGSIKIKHCERCMTQFLKGDIALNDFIRFICNIMEASNVKERKIYL